MRQRRQAYHPWQAQVFCGRSLGRVHNNVGGAIPFHRFDTVVTCLSGVIDLAYTNDLVIGGMKGEVRRAGASGGLTVEAIKRRVLLARCNAVLGTGFL